MIRIPVSNSTITIVCFAAITFVGIGAAFMDRNGPHSREDQVSTFVQTAIPTKAIITAKWNRPRNQPQSAHIIMPSHGSASSVFVDYSYSVNGRQYADSSYVPENVWAHLSVGDPIDVYYDPQNPSHTEYQPQQWIKNQQSVTWVAPVVIFVGLIGMLLGVVGLVAEQTGSRFRILNVFGFPGCFGLALTIAGIGIQCVFVWQAIFGGGAVMRYNDGPPHVMEWWEWIAMGLFLAIFWGIGLLILSGSVRDTPSDESIEQ